MNYSLDVAAGCSGSSAVGYIGGSGNGVLTFNNVASNAATRTTLRIKHLVELSSLAEFI
jgi:hypothetical protein